MIEANDQVDNAFQKGLNTWPNSWSWHVRCLIIKNVVTARFITSTNNLLRHNILNYTIIKMRNRIATNPPTKMAYWKNIESKVGNMQFRGWMSWWGNIDITRSKHPCRKSFTMVILDQVVDELYPIHCSFYCLRWIERMRWECYAQSCFFLDCS